MTESNKHLVTKDQYFIELNQERLITALSKLQDVNNLMTEAENDNSLAELAGLLPSISTEVGDQIYQIKKYLGITPTEFEEEMYSRSNETTN